MNEATSVPATEPIALDWLGLGAALVTVVLWASAFVGIRAVADDLSPGALAVGRLLREPGTRRRRGARRPAWPSRRDLAWIAAVGVVWFGAYTSAQRGEQLVDAGTAACSSTSPNPDRGVRRPVPLEGFRRGCIGRRRVRGTIVIGLATSGGSVDASAPIGSSCALGCPGLRGGVTIQKPILAGRRPAGTWLASASARRHAPFLRSWRRARDGTDLAVGWLVYSALFPTAIAFTTWAFALNRTTAGRLGSTTYLVPPVAILLAWLMLSEVPPVLALAGGALCIGGVIVARSRGRSVSSPSR